MIAGHLALLAAAAFAGAALYINVASSRRASDWAIALCWRNGSRATPEASPCRPAWPWFRAASEL
jgi:hypothetical protein